MKKILAWLILIPFSPFIGAGWLVNLAIDQLELPI